MLRTNLFRIDPENKSSCVCGVCLVCGRCIGQAAGYRYVPEPIDTSKTRLPAANGAINYEKLIDKLAWNSHEVSVCVVG
jgi:hypothetical protein